MKNQESQMNLTNNLNHDEIIFVCLYSSSEKICRKKKVQRTEKICCKLMCIN